MDTLSGNYKTDQSYEYDDLYQLIHVTGNTEYYPAISSVPDYKSTYTQDFAFDDKGLGNMMSKVSKETVSPLKVIGDNLNYNIGYVYDENYAHRLVQAGNRYYKYDANGNIICEQDGSFDGSENDVSYYKVEQHSEDVYSTDNGWGLFKDESGEGRGQTHRYRRTYTWNSRNQLVSTIDSNYSTSYVYGQDGQRSNKYTQGSETLYFNKMWTLHTDNGNSVYGGQYAKNVYLGETRIVTKLARADQKTAHEEMYKQYYYHSDHLGSATMISDWEGKEYQRIEYTPYGETWVEKTNNSGSEFLPYKFTGKEVDQETGLYYYGARYLDPKYSMWISTDPALGEYVPEMGKGNAKDSGSLPGMGGVYNHINFHLYHYAGNNPVRFVDSDGRAILATNYAYNLFNNTKNETKYITNSYNHPQFHLISNFAYYNCYGRFELLDSYDKEKEHYFKSKQEMNLERLGNSVFNFYKTITSEISKSDNGNIKYESKLMPEKYDNDGNQCYELSVTVKDKKSILFYYSSIEARNQEQLKTLIGEFISLFNEGSKDDWKPNKNISIDGETPYN